MIQYHEVAHQAAARTESLERGPEDPREVSPRAANEYGVRVGKVRKCLRRCTVDDPHRPRKALHILAQQLDLAAIRLDRIDEAAVDETGRLQADGPTSGADVPDNVASMKSQQAHTHRAHLR